MYYPKYWNTFFEQQLHQKYFFELFQKYQILKQQFVLYPQEKDIFNAFNYFDVQNLKVVILGQDPYYIEHYANGLAFAVNQDINIPKSLNNIFKEIQNEFGIIHTDRTLISWAKQGVLLLNTSLLVIKDQPNSLKDMGWEQFVLNLIAYINLNKTHVVYLLWGNNAKKFAPYIDAVNNLILCSAHPSPLSAKNFFGNNHFKKCNDYLNKHNLQPIVW